MKKLMIAVSALALAFTSSAAQFFLKTDATDLSLAASYSAGVLPGAGDEIVLDSGATYVVNDEALAVINGVRELWLDNQTVIELDVADGSEITAGIRAFEGKVVKKNTGTVATKGTFSAALDVNAGRMQLRDVNGPKVKAFKYYRVSFAACSNSSLSLRQFCLYAADGTRQNKGLIGINDVSATDVNSNYTIPRTEVADIPAGGVAWDVSMAGMLQGATGGDNRCLAYMFSSIGNKTMCSYSIYDQSIGKWLSPTVENTGAGKWISFVMHLADDAKPITHFDFNLGWVDPLTKAPTRLQIEGSIDGNEWTVVWSNVNSAAIEWSGNAHVWLSTMTSNEDDSYADTRTLANDYKYKMSANSKIYQKKFPYKWFRYSVARLGDNDSGHVHNVRQLCLYAADGTRQNGGLTILNDVGNGGKIAKVDDIPAGSVAFDENMVGWTCVDSTGNNVLATLMGSNPSKMINAYFYDANGTLAQHNLAEPKTWFRCIMHLADKAKPVTHFDLELGYTTSSGNHPTRVQIEGSLDGKVWDVVWSNLDAESGWAWTTASNFEWMSGLSANGTQGSYLDNETYNLNGPLNLTASAGQYHDNPGLPYKWFRCSIAKIGADDEGLFNNNWSDDKTGGMMNLGQFCLYSADGVRQNLNMSAVNDDSLDKYARYLEGDYNGYVNAELAAPGEIPAGCCAWDASMAGRWKRGGWGKLYQILDGNYGADIKFCFTKVGTEWNRADPNPGDPLSWYTFVMHLKDDAKPITHFDIQGYSNDNSYMPTRVKLEGSFDGKRWIEVWSNVEGDAIDWGEDLAAAKRWASDPADVGSSHSKLPYKLDFMFNLKPDTSVAYKWLRYSIAQLGNGGSKDNNIRQLCFYAADGSRQNAGLNALNDANTASGDGIIRAVSEIPAGYAAWDKHMDGWKQWDEGNNNPMLETLMSASDKMAHVSFRGVNGSDVKPTPNDPSTWITCVMHLAADAQPVTHFDMELGYTRTYSSMPTRILIEGSLDGENWATVWSNLGADDALLPWTDSANSDYAWMSGLPTTGKTAAYISHEAFDPASPYNLGAFELTKETVLGEVKVAAGAELAFEWGDNDGEKITTDPTTGKVNGGKETEVELQNGVWVEKSGSTLTGDPVTDLVGDRKLAFYRSKATVKIGGRAVDMVSDDIIGALKVDNSANPAAIGVPWAKMGSGAVSVEDVLVTSALSEGDVIYVYGNGAYQAWRWNGSAWQPLNTVTKELIVGAQEAATVSLQRGKAFWLERVDTTKPIILAGRYDQTAVTTTIDTGTSGSKAWNLIASPKPTSFDLNTAISGEIGANDQVLVPTAGAPIVYTYDGEKWGCVVNESVKIGSRDVVKPVRHTDDAATTVPAGHGFWYISGEDKAPTFNW